MDSDTAGVGRRVLSASAWTVSTRLVIRGIGLVSTVVLARLIAPEDLGLIAMAMILYQIIEALSEFHFNAILLVERHAGRDYYDTVWTLMVIRGAAIAGILCLLAAPAATFFREPRVETIVYVLGVVALLGGANNVGVVNFQKDFRFGLDFVYLVGTKLCAFTVTVALAVRLGSYAALVAGTVASAAASTILSYALQSYRPSPSLSRWREVLRFSRWLLVSNVLHTLYRRADTFFIGKLSGASAVGLYTVALDISAMPAEMLLLPIRRALLPGYAQLAQDADKLRRVFLDGFGLTLLFVMPVTVGMALTADSLVRIVLGTRWLDAIPLIQILAFLGCFRACSSNFSQLYVALGRPELVSGRIATTTALGLPLIVGGVYFGGAVGAAYMVTAAGAFNVVMTFALAMRQLGLSSVKIVGPVGRTALATLAMAVPVLAIGQSWGEPGSTGLLAAKFVTQVLIGAAVFVNVQWLLWRIWGFPRGPESQIVEFGRGWVAKLHP